MISSGFHGAASRRWSPENIIHSTALCLSHIFQIKTRNNGEKNERLGKRASENIGNHLAKFMPGCTLVRLILFT
jgi:hypothetical protein